MSATKYQKKIEKVAAVSLFSGCGGSDYALVKAGYRVAWANDLWSQACETHQDNLPDSKMECGDIKDFTSFPSAKLLVGCYPCQGYTQGGKRDWNAPVNFLYREFDRVLNTIQPKAFVVENVIGMTFGANKERLQDQLDRYGKNYIVKHAVLNAKDFGVAQNRRRVFLVGVHRDLNFSYEFPSATHGPQHSKPFKTQQTALKGLALWPEGEFNTEPLHWYYLSRRRRCDWNEPSPCIVGHWRHVPLHPLSPPLERLSTDEWRFKFEGPNRRLSFRECAALQGFPRGFKWHRGSIRDKFQMIGNAVPPPLFKAVLKPLEDLWQSN